MGFRDVKKNVMFREENFSESSNLQYYTVLPRDNCNVDAQK